MDYEPLPAVVSAVAALDADAPLVHPEFGTNATLTAASTFGEPDGEFAAAECRLAVHVGHGRVAALPIETRGGIAAYDAETGKYTLWLSTQAAWSERTDLAKALGIAEDDFHVITPDVGGAFGGKMTAYRETILLLALARITGRPVRWIASRTEDLQTSMHGREAVTDGEVAFDRDGRIRALRLRTVANFGAYLMKYSGGPPMRMILFPTGAYTIRHVHSEVVGVFTNTGPMGPYRGAGRPEAAYFIERVMSDVAHYLGMDQAEIRRKTSSPPMRSRTPMPRTLSMTAAITNARWTRRSQISISGACRPNWWSAVRGATSSASVSPVVSKSLVAAAKAGPSPSIPMGE